MNKLNKNLEKKVIAADILTALAQASLKLAANSKCMCVYHQPKMPKQLKTFKKH